MKCPYDTKVNACVYLDEMTQDDREYDCPDCPHFKPRSYYDRPEAESFAMSVISVCLIALILMGFGYIALKAIKIAIQWFQ
jgi:hypothetical protein